MPKKIFYTALACFLAYLSISTIQLLLVTTPDQFGIGVSFIVAFMINLCITGVFAYLGFSYPTHKSLPASYYEVTSSSRIKSLYKLLGVEYFKIALLTFFWGHDKNRKKYFNGTKSGISNFIYETKQSEFGHLGALVAVGVASVLLLISGHTSVAIIATLVNIIANFYPIILQRMHRSRVSRIFSNQRT